MPVPARTAASILSELGLPAADLHELPGSAVRFADGSQYRVEIPSTEGPECRHAVFEEAASLGVPIHRVSQGSGVFLLTDDELDEMAGLAAAHHAEVSLFARPTAGWGPSAMALAPAGAAAAPAVRGAGQLAAALDDVCRAADRGFRSVLVSDIGLLAAFGQARARGLLPADMQAKVSVMLPVANPASARLVTELGAGTLNIPTDLTLAQIAAVRSVTDIPLDIYVEAPDNLGGFLRHHEIPELVRIAAPVYLKFGLRNAPDIYPSGSHLSATAVALSRARVRRARLGLDLLQRSGVTAVSHPPAESAGLAVPQPNSAVPSHPASPQ
jgi:Peptidase family U32